MNENILFNKEYESQKLKSLTEELTIHLRKSHHQKSVDMEL